MAGDAAAAGNRALAVRGGRGLDPGVVVGFVARVKPEMLGLKNHGGHGEQKQKEAAECNDKVRVV